VNSQSSTCPDAETLAAWSDQGLTPVEQRQVDAHVAGCARCLAYVAAMAKSDPVTDQQPVRERAWLNWRWFAPLAAAVAATGLWFAVKTTPQVPTGATGATGAKGASDLPAVARSAEAGAAPLEARQQAPKATPQAARPSVAADAKDAAPVPAVPPPAASSAPASPATNESVATRALTAPMAMRQADAIPTRDIVSSDGTTRWRIRGATVERTTDAGATWTAQPTGAHAALAAGASPSADVCWIVGRAGTVILTTDGRTWTTVAFPETVDLLQVTAASGSRATVTTSDARRFTTDDGGITWKSGDVQDF